MYLLDDFKIDKQYLHVKNDIYPLSKIRDVQVKRLSIRDNLYETFFWVAVMSAAVWLAWSPEYPTWFLFLAVLLTFIGLIMGIYRSAKYQLQIKFMHSDETGLQWLQIARSKKETDLPIFEKQVELIKEKFKQN